MRPYRRHEAGFGLALVMPLMVAACASSGRAGKTAVADRTTSDTAATAYGTPTRSDRGRAERLSRVTAADIDRAGNIDLARFIETRLSGVRVIGSGGQYAVYVTGSSSFQAGTGALVLIDGTEGSLGSLRMTDIESIEVLKNSATGIYGVRGANGVLLIATRKK